MELIRGLHNIRPEHHGCVATIGAFDGVHRGHQAVLNTLKEKSIELGLPSLVITLEPLPREYFAPDEAPARIMSFREKCIALDEQGIDRVLRIHFDKKTSLITAEDFVTEIFCKQLGVKYMIAGDDLHFGYERQGNFQLLQKMGRALGFAVEDTTTIELEGERVSSSRIRESLGQADFALARQLMGRPYSITGKVIYGQQLGRTIGAPTINLQLHRRKTALSGVYTVKVDIDGKMHHGVANVGTRPTLEHGLKAILEVHILDFSGDLYGKVLRVEFHSKLRDEKKFNSLDELKAAINSDIETARTVFADS